MQMIIIFIVKVLDNLLATSKTILVQKNKPLLAALSVTLSQFIFYRLVSQVLSGDSPITIYIVVIASGVGTYLALKLSDKFSRDSIYTHTLLCDDLEVITNGRDYFMDKKVDNLIVPTIAKDGSKSFALLVFAHTKSESRMVETFIEESNTKIKRVLQKN